MSILFVQFNKVDQNLCASHYPELSGNKVDFLEKDKHVRNKSHYVVRAPGWGWGVHRGSSWESLPGNIRDDLSRSSLDGQSMEGHLCIRNSIAKSSK